MISAEVARSKQHRRDAVAGRREEATVQWLEALLFRHDPIGINFEHNTDEYRAEAETIALRLDKCTSADDVQRMVHDEFMRWFGDDVAGPPERYAAIASEIWGGWSAEVS